MSGSSKFPIDPSLSSQVVPDVPSCRLSLTPAGDSVATATGTEEDIGPA